MAHQIQQLKPTQAQPDLGPTQIWENPSPPAAVKYPPDQNTAATTERKTPPPEPAGNKHTELVGHQNVSNIHRRQPTVLSGATTVATTKRSQHLQHLQKTPTDLIGAKKHPIFIGDTFETQRRSQNQALNHPRSQTPARFHSLPPPAPKHNQNRSCKKKTKQKQNQSESSEKSSSTAPSKPPDHQTTRTTGDVWPLAVRPRTGRPNRCWPAGTTTTVVSTAESPANHRTARADRERNGEHLPPNPTKTAEGTRQSEDSLKTAGTSSPEAPKSPTIRNNRRNPNAAKDPHFRSQLPLAVRPRTPLFQQRNRGVEAEPPPAEAGAAGNGGIGEEKGAKKGGETTRSTQQRGEERGRRRKQRRRKGERPGGRRRRRRSPPRRRTLEFEIQK